jgi:hypothetical protein
LTNLQVFSGFQSIQMFDEYELMVNQAIEAKQEIKLYFGIYFGGFVRTTMITLILL